VHKLSNVASFSFLDYLRKALTGHIIHIIEPSKKTWLTIMLLGAIMMKIDDAVHIETRYNRGSYNDYGELMLAPDERPEGETPPYRNVAPNVTVNPYIAANALVRGWTSFRFGPNEVSFGYHIAWLGLNWFMAFCGLFTHFVALRAYQNRIKKIFEYSPTEWKKYYKYHRPSHYSQVSKLPEAQQQLHYMLFGFVNTNGRGPQYTDPSEGSIGEDTNEAAPAPASADAAASVIDVQVTPAKSWRYRNELSAHSLSGWLVNNRMSTMRPASVSSALRHTRYIRRLLEMGFSVYSFLVAWHFMFWAREFNYIAFRLYPEMNDKMAVGWQVAALKHAAERPHDGVWNCTDYQLNHNPSFDPCLESGFSLLDSTEVARMVLIPMVEWVLWLCPLIIFFVVSLRTMELFSVATAVKQVDNSIIGAMEQEREKEGAYVQAMLLQRNHLERTYPDLDSYEKIKERLNSMIKLAEMYWRYKAVLQDESPLEQTIKTLANAQKTIGDFLEHYDESPHDSSHRGSGKCTTPRGIARGSSMSSSDKDKGDPAGPADSSPPGSFKKKSEEGEETFTRGHHIDFRKELGAIYMYHAVARNIHSPNLEEGLVKEYLEKSKELREKIEDFTGLADTLNAMGMLKMRHKLFVEAKAIFEKAVDIRVKDCSSDHGGLAQAYVSLGQAVTALGRLKATGVGKSCGAEASVHFKEAESHLYKALAEYKMQFKDNHPKVANAHQYIAEVLFEQGDYTKGEQHLDEAINIRRSAQDGADGHMLFSKEINDLVSRKEAIADLKKPKVQQKTSLKWRRAVSYMASGGDAADGDVDENSKPRIRLPTMTSSPGSDSRASMKRQTSSFFSAVKMATLQKNSATSTGGEDGAPSSLPSSPPQLATMVSASASTDESHDVESPLSRLQRVASNAGAPASTRQSDSV